MTQREKNFIELYFEAVDENIDEVIGKLKDSGIDPEESEKRILQMIKKQKAEIKIENGKKLKAKVEKIVKSKPETAYTTVNEERYSIAARKLGSLDKDDIQSIKKDAELLEDIGQLFNTDKNDTGKSGI